MAFVGKVYTHDRDDNFDGLVDSYGLPADRAAAMKNYKPKHKLEKNGDTFSITTFSQNSDNVITFKLGEELNETVGEGRIAKTIFKLDGNTLTQVQKFEDGNSLTTKREYFDDKMIATLTRTGWDGTAIRYYKA